MRYKNHRKLKTYFKNFSRFACQFSATTSGNTNTKNNQGKNWPGLCCARQTLFRVVNILHSLVNCRHTPLNFISLISWYSSLCA